MGDFEFHFNDGYLHPKRLSSSADSISPPLLPLANTIDNGTEEENRQPCSGRNMPMRKQSDNEEEAYWEALWQLDEDTTLAGPSYSSRYRQASQMSVFDDDLVIVNVMDNSDFPASLHLPPPFMCPLSLSSMPSPFTKNKEMQPRGWRQGSSSSVYDSPSLPDSRDSSLLAKGSKPIDIPRKSPLTRRDDFIFTRSYLNYDVEQSTTDMDSPILRPASPPQKAPFRARNPFIHAQYQVSLSSQEGSGGDSCGRCGTSTPSSDKLPVVLRKGLCRARKIRTNSDVSDLDLGSALIDSGYRRDYGEKANAIGDDQSPVISATDSENPYGLPVSTSLSTTPLLLRGNHSESDSISSIQSFDETEMAIFPFDEDEI